MKSTQNFNLEDYIKKINKAEVMLKELKQGLSYFDIEFQKSVKMGEKDIKEGKVTICRTEEELNNFFASV